jgi:tetratricopeptide (TPR) repeat protein
MGIWIVEKGANDEYPQSIEIGFKAHEAFETEAAQKWFQRAMNSSDLHESQSGVIGAAALEAKWGSVAKAKELLKSVADAGRLDAAVNLGKVLFEEGNLQAAERYFNQAVSANSVQTVVKASALNALGCVAVEHEQINLAENYFEQAAELGDIKAKSNLAALAEERGDINVARSWLWEIREDAEAKISYNQLTFQIIEELKKPWCFPETLEERSRDFDVQVRRVVAGNSTTPKHVLDRLLEDSDVSVRKTAQKTLIK